jgi:hypothetical protein
MTEHDPNAMRASDEERETTVSALKRHLADGRLDWEEFSERMDRAYTARTRAELDALITDLPAAAAAGPEPDPEPGTSRLAGWRRRIRRMPVPVLAALGVLLALIWTAGAFAIGSHIGDPNPGWGPGHGPGYGYGYGPGYGYGYGWGHRPGWGFFPFPFPFPIVPLLFIGFIVARFGRRRRWGRTR